MTSDERATLRDYCDRCCGSKRTRKSLHCDAHGCKTVLALLDALDAAEAELQTEEQLSRAQHDRADAAEKRANERDSALSHAEAMTKEEQLRSDASMGLDGSPGNGAAAWACSEIDRLRAALSITPASSLAALRASLRADVWREASKMPEAARAFWCAEATMEEVLDWMDEEFERRAKGETDPPKEGK